MRFSDSYNRLRIAVDERRAQKGNIPLCASALILGHSEALVSGSLALPLAPLPFSLSGIQGKAVPFSVSLLPFPQLRPFGFPLFVCHDGVFCLPCLSGFGISLFSVALFVSSVTLFLCFACHDSPFPSFASIPLAPQLVC